MQNCCKKNVASLLHEAGRKLNEMGETGGVVGGGCHRCGTYAEVKITLGVSE